MRLGEALATCPELVLLEQDPAGVVEAWEAILRQLEEAGFEIEPLEPGFVLFDTAPVELLAGGLQQALERAMAAVDSRWQPSLGVAARRFAAIAASHVTAPGRILVVDDTETALFLEPLPLHLLPLSQERREELSELGIQRLGELACLPRASVADRFGAEGDEAWMCARSEDRARVVPRQPPVDLAESIEFPDPVATSGTLEHATARLIDLLLARPDRGGRAFRKVAVSARLVSGGSWRQGLRGIEPKLSPSQKMMLSLQQRAPGHIISVKSLNRLGDYGCPQKAFDAYLQIATRLSDELAYTPSVRRKGSKAKLALMCEEISASDVVPELALTLKPELVSALELLG